MLIFSLILSTLVHAQMPPNCQEFLTKASQWGVHAPTRLLQEYRNNDRFADWFERQNEFTFDALVEEHRANSKAWMEGFRSDMTDSERESHLASSPTDDQFIDRVLNAFAEAPPSGEPTPVREVKTVELKNFLREHSTYFNKNEWERVETNDVYEHAVVSLRHGDQVVFSDATYTLGRFIGQGNTTLIFALERYPKLVIRIPYVAGALNDRGIHPDHIPKQMMRTKPLIPWNRVWVKKVGRNFEYMLVSKIDGEETGEAYLGKLPNRASAAVIDHFFDITRDMHHAWRTEKMSHALVLNALGHAMVLPVTIWRLHKASRPGLRTMTLKTLKLMATLYAHPYEPKQFIWNGRRWILVDWE